MLTAEEERQWLDAIIQDDSDRARAILSNTSSISDLTLHGLSEQPHILRIIQSKCAMTSSPYIPDNAVCLAALFNTRKVIEVMLEFGVPITQTNSQNNTFLHCMIAFASTQSEYHETQYIKTINWIKSAISCDDFRCVILTENRDGLRPLELAAHLGTFIMFTSIFETEDIYLSKTQELNFHTVQYYDITDYVTGKRYYTSPVNSITTLDRSKLDQKSTRDMFENDPMASWFNAVISSNMPFIFTYAFLRFTVIVNFFVSLVITKATDGPLLLRNTTNISSIDEYCIDLKDKSSVVLLILLSYNIGGSVILLAFDLMCFILCVASYNKLKWKQTLVSRHKNIVLSTGWINMCGWTSFFGILIMSIIMFKQLQDANVSVCFSTTYLDIMVLMGVLGSVWDILCFLQYVPGLNLYVIAVQHILTDTIPFSVIFAFFFLTYAIGFYLFGGNTFEFGSSLYETFRLMLNMIDLSHSNNALQIFHAAFVFLIVNLLLNILIAIFISSFEYVTKHRAIIARVQCLAIALCFELLLSKLLLSIYNKLRKRHLVFEDGKVCVTKVIMRPVHMGFNTGDGCE